jgi:hypothetical protein
VSNVILYRIANPLTHSHPSLVSSQSGSSSSEVPTAKGGVPPIAPRRVQPTRKARQTAQDRVLKNIVYRQDSELSVGEENPLIKINKQLPARRANHPSPNAEPNVGPAPIPEFVQGSSHSPSVGAKRAVGPSSQAVTGEGPRSKRTARPVNPLKGGKQYNHTRCY